jgi:hypothetical protein
VKVADMVYCLMAVKAAGHSALVTDITDTVSSEPTHWAQTVW